MTTSRPWIRAGLALAAMALLVSSCADDTESPAEGAEDSTEAGGGDQSGASSTEARDVAMTFPTDGWDRVTPEEAGLDAQALEELAALAEAEDSLCLAVTRDGRLVGEWYFGESGPTDTTQMWSATKSMSSTLVGIAEEQGLLDLDDPAADYLPEWEGTNSEDITIRNLISNDSGRFWSFETDYEQLPTDEDITEFALSLGQEHEPGTQWEYNNAAIQTLDAVLESATGEGAAAFAQRELLDPIGMDDTNWLTDPSGNLFTFMGAESTCLDAARFGNLFLAEGVWGDEQVVPADFAREATGEPSQDLNGAYGFLWWRNTDGGWISPTNPGSTETEDSVFWPDVPLDAYAAQGLGGQTIAVHPSSGVVLTRLAPTGGLGASDTPLKLQQAVAAAVVD